MTAPSHGTGQCSQGRAAPSRPTRQRFHALAYPSGAAAQGRAEMCSPGSPILSNSITLADLTNTHTGVPAGLQGHVHEPAKTIATGAALLKCMPKSFGLDCEGRNHMICTCLGAQWSDQTSYGGGLKWLEASRRSYQGHCRLQSLLLRATTKSSACLRTMALTALSR